jgi:hypothetical protein
MPFEPPDPGLLTLIVAASSSNGPTRVAVGTISTPRNELPAVREDNAVANGRVVPNEGKLTAILKCALPGCAGPNLVSDFALPDWIRLFGSRAALSTHGHFPLGPPPTLTHSKAFTPRRRYVPVAVNE